ncbi:microbial collagenase [Ferrimonas sediminum]|uniref:Microbial collagenase n=1 Tax=Ferrimonas sediminum TaxID=718193 RepID=A0A1G8KK39_9GAMM|nr:collagenase [Ferrimonas sediminum]SDI43811.1 microbial collagenase [Ferrimonas sediminum]
MLTSALVYADKGPATPTVDQLLGQQHRCSGTLLLRSQALTDEQQRQACEHLLVQEARFHQLFGTEGSPVADDNNLAMRANVYRDRDSYVAHVTAHFNVPSDNGGMYLEGTPSKPGNQAEFVAYQKQGTIWNLNHEYVHYLDGRFNLYGDFCMNLHDDHSAPEYCPEPTPPLPHLVWWSEGVAEYIALGSDNPKALALAAKGGYTLSELFNTSYNANGGSDRVYRWGYLAVRFMMEQQRSRVEQMLTLTRRGDYQGYQKLVAGWGQQMDADFDRWLAEAVGLTN